MEERCSPKALARVRFPVRVIILQLFIIRMHLFHIQIIIFERILNRLKYYKLQDKT